MNSRLREKGRRALDKKNEQEKSTEGEEFTGKESDQAGPGTKYIKKYT